MIIDVIMQPQPVQAVDIGNLGGGGGGIDEAPQNGDIYGRVDGTWQRIDYTTLPTEVQLVPISFPFSGAVPQGVMINVPMAMPLAIPAGLAGTVVYAGTPPSLNATFTLNKISGGVSSGLGAITINVDGSATLSGSGGMLAIGDVLQIDTPSVATGALADIGITVLAQRVGG